MLNYYEVPHVKQVGSPGNQSVSNGSFSPPEMLNLLSTDILKICTNMIIYTVYQRGLIFSGFSTMYVYYP